jgi:hypothetical protein
MAKNRIQVSYPTMLVLSAAFAAQRTNKGYYKYSVPDGSYVDGEGVPSEAKVTNRELVYKYLEDQSNINNEDRANAEKLKAYYQGKLFKVLAEGYVSEFDRSAMKLVEREELIGSYDMAIATSLPASYFKGVQRDEGEQRAKFAQGGYLGSVGDRVTANIEVLKCIFSQKWNVYFITAITDKDQSIFFSYKQDVNYGSKFAIKGTVKRQDNNQTQLNRVQVI